MGKMKEESEEEEKKEKGKSEEAEKGRVGKLGKVEKRILYELDQDATQTLGEIGKKIKKSPQYVEYWIKKFADEKIIKYYIAVIDYKKLGYTYYHVYYSLRGMSPDLEDKFVEYVLKQRNVGTVFRFHGAWDVDIAIFAKDPLELYEVLSKINEKYGEHIGDYTIETHVGAHHLGRRYLFEGAEPKPYVPITGGPVERAKVDEEDIKILSAIKENTRASTIELAEISGLTPDIVRYRLKKLKENKIVVGAIFMPGENYPYRFYRLLVKFKGLTPDKEKEVISFFSAYPNVWRINKTFGSYNMSIDLDVETTDVSRRILTELRSKFYDILVDFDILHVWNMVKHCYFINVGKE